MSYRVPPLSRRGPRMNPLVMERWLVSTIPSYSLHLFEPYVRRIRHQTFCDRIDTVERKEAVVRKHVGILPTLQPSFPDMLECLAEKARLRRAEMENDFAEDIKEIREFRERFEVDQKEPPTPPPTHEQQLYLADLIKQAWCHKRWRRQLDGSCFKRERHDVPLPAPVSSFPEEVKVHRVDKPHLPGRPLIPLPVYADPVVEKSGIQFFTGTQLDMLV